MKNQKKKSYSWIDSTYLLDFEKYVLDKYSLLKNWPILRKWRLGRAIDKWNR